MMEDQRKYIWGSGSRGVFCNGQHPEPQSGKYLAIYQGHGGMVLNCLLTEAEIIDRMPARVAGNPVERKVPKPNFFDRGINFYSHDAAEKMFRFVQATSEEIADQMWPL